MEKPTEPTDAEASERPARPTWGRRRIAQLLFALGCFAVLVSILPDVPQEREIRLYLEDPGPVTELSLTFRDPDGIPVRGTKFQFTRGSAKRVWVTKVSLPEGHYRVESRVARGDRAEEAEHEIVVDGDAHIEIRLR